MRASNGKGDAGSSKEDLMSAPGNLRGGDLENQPDDPHDEEDDEQYLCDSGRFAGNLGEAEDAGDDGNNEKDECPV